MQYYVNTIQVLHCDILQCNIAVILLKYYNVIYHSTMSFKYYIEIYRKAVLLQYPNISV